MRGIAEAIDRGCKFNFRHSFRQYLIARGELRIATAQAGKMCAS